MTDTNMDLQTEIQRLCAVEEWARRVSEEFNPGKPQLHKRQRHALEGLDESLSHLAKARAQRANCTRSARKETDR